jgi:hypothetical protein
MDERNIGAARTQFSQNDFLGYQPNELIKAQLDIAIVLKEVWRMITLHWPAIGAIVLLFDFAPMMLIGLFEIRDNIWPGLRSLDGDGQGIWRGALTIISIVSSSIASFVLSAYIVAQKTSLGFRFQPLLALLLPMLALQALLALGIIAGAILLVIPGIYLATAWSVSLPALVCEALGPRQSLARSFSLTAGNRWQVFWLLFIVMLFSFLFQGLWGPSGDTIEDEGFFPLITVGVTAIASCISNALWSLAAVAIYFQLRLLAEGPLTDEVATIFE